MINDVCIDDDRDLNAISLILIFVAIRFTPAEVKFYGFSWRSNFCICIIKIVLVCLIYKFNRLASQLGNNSRFL